MRRILLVFFVIAALPLSADRVRVIVAVGLPELSAASLHTLRAEVIGSLSGATDVQPWGSRGRAFSVEVDREEIDHLRRDPRVAAVSLDEGGHGALMQSVPLVGGDVVHAQGYTGSGVAVAVLDTGIDVTNADFAGRIAAQQCFCDNLDGTGCCPNRAAIQSGPGAAKDDNGHGTHVSGILAGGGASAPGGMAPAARIVAVKVMDADNSFRSFTQIYRGLEWVANNRPDVRVINMSLGSWTLYTTEDCAPNAIALGLGDLVATLRRRGVLIVASTGNQGSIIGTSMPSCMQNVVAVGATYDTAGDKVTPYCSDTDVEVDQMACFTNSTDAIDLLAPGAMITASRRGGGAVTYAGTSMAAPHVSGALALMQQVSGGRLSPDDAEIILKTTGVPVLDRRNGLVFPRIDVAKAVSVTPHLPPARRRAAPPHEPPVRRRPVRH